MFNVQVRLSRSTSDHLALSSSDLRAHFGPSRFVSQHVLEVLCGQEGSEQRRATKRLMDLAHELSVWRKSDEDDAPDL